MKGKYVANEIKRIDSRISGKCGEVRLELQRARVIIMGNEDPEASTVLTAVVTAPLWLPFFIVIGVLLFAATIVLSPFLMARIAFSKTMTEKQIDELYTACAQRLTKARIQNILGSIFKDHFKNRIKSIFEKELPREIVTIQRTIKFLCKQKNQIRNNINMNLRLRESLRKIKADLKQLT